MLNELINDLRAPSGEKAVLDTLENTLRPYVTDCRRDGFGNLILTKKGKSAHTGKLAFTVSVDLPGFIVHFIEENGLARVTALGKSDLLSCAYAGLRFDNGAKGILVPEKGTEPGSLTLAKMAVDFGTSSRAETEKLISLGSTATLLAGAEQIGENLVRGFGCGSAECIALAADLAKEAVSEQYDLYFIFTIQSNLRGRGAKTATYDIAPDIAVGIRSCPANDVPGADKTCGGKLGGSFCLALRNGKATADEETTEKLKSAAARAGVPCHSFLSDEGGEDVGVIASVGAGTKTACVCLPVRYAGTQAETVDLRDAESAKKALLEFIRG